MFNAVKREEAQIALLSSCLLEHVAVAATLGKLEKWVNIVLPIRSLMFYLILRHAKASVQDHWADTEASLFYQGEASVHTLSKWETARENKEKLIAMIDARKLRVLPYTVLEPCLAILVLMFIGAIL